MSIELKKQIESALKAFDASNLRESSISLLNILGYDSDKRIDIDSKPDTFFDMLKSQSPKEFDADNFRKKTLFDQWKSASLLFQLTDDDISKQQGLFGSNKVDCNFLKSYVFFAVSLSGKDYPRGTLANIARQINRVFPMPVMVLITYDKKLTIAIINRRPDKRKHLDRDVLEKVTLIKDVKLPRPHRAHIEILFDFSIDNLRESRQVANFDDLHEAWSEILNVEALNKRFYKSIQEWFFWAVKSVIFPHGGNGDDDLRNRTALIRLLTRIVFCWFAKEKGLIPESLFDSGTAVRVLKSFEPISDKDGSYYKAILQNLFFPTLSIPLDQREFRNGHRYKGVNKHYMRHEYFRYENLFKDSDDLGRLFSEIPFLNGGLFECLDSGTCKENEIRVDGFSDVTGNQPFVPNILFFGQKVQADLRDSLGSDKKDSVKVDGLFHILEAYKFTIAENTPVEEEIALDPELLGRIFENLLAEYNPETRQTARKQTGSFYTPRNIVDYMVDESLKAYLKQILCSKFQMTHEDADTGLEILFNYTEKEHPFNEKEKLALVDAIYDIKVLDPACGSGAFPMGMLHKLVYVLEKLDTGHERWKKRILDETPVEMREETKKLLNRSSTDHNWKLGLVLHSIYGVDIQPIAVQIAKLRCFISLLVDFPVDEKAENKGVPALPNLDFKFVAANTLIKPPSAIERDDELGFEDQFFTKFAKAAESYFFVRDPEQKRCMRIEIEKLIDEKIKDSEKALVSHRGDEHASEKIRKAIAEKNKEIIEKTKCEIEIWKSYHNIFAFRNQHVEFFDIRYFFPEVKDGFDIVIGNPPYVQIQNFSGTQTQKDLEAQKYETFVKTGDIYCLFYERGYQLLKVNGVLSYISSNKWMRANYGSKMRKFFAEKTNPVKIVDFDNYSMFDATVNTNIIIVAKTKNLNSLQSVSIKEDFNKTTDIADYLKTKGVLLKSLGEDSWLISSDEEYALKKRIEVAGVPLKDWDIQINYGVKTGFNEAFIIDGNKKAELIAKDRKSAEVIKPILLGRNIKRYRIENECLWVIFIPWHFPLNNDPSISGASEKAEKQFKKEYPAVYGHLFSFKDSLTKRNLTETGIRYEWYALQRCAASYYGEFAKQKITWGNLALSSQFTFAESDYVINAPGTMITPPNKYLLAVLNSKVGDYYIRSLGVTRSGGYFEYKPMFVENLPVPKLSKTEQKPFEELVDKILGAKKSNSSADTSEFESQIDQLVYELYGLTDDEINIVEEK